MSIDLRHLRVVVAAADRGSFSSAAVQLNMEISAVSRAIRDVEESLGFAMFERLPRGVRLTAEGEAYVASARDILTRVTDAERLARQAGSNGAGGLSLGLVWPATSWRSADLLAGFVADNPEVMLRVVQDGQGALLARVRSGELHVAITATEPEPYLPLRVHSDLDSLALWVEPLAIAVPASEPTPSLTWADLQGRWLLCRPHYDWRRIVAHVERLGGPTLHFIEQDVSGEGLLALAGAGLGWTLVPSSITGAEAVGAKLVPVEDEGAATQAEAVWLPRIQNPALNRFLNLVRRLYASPLADAPSRSPGQ
jgi:DNA-binding transcriptional LysR family regulator